MSVSNFTMVEVFELVTVYFKEMYKKLSLFLNDLPLKSWFFWKGIAFIAILPSLVFISDETNHTSFVIMGIGVFQKCR